MTATVRAFRPEDYAAARALWLATDGVGLSPGDGKAEVRAFLARNEGLSLVAHDGDALVAAALCGHDGRRGYIYHLAVAPTHRRRGLGRAIAARCLDGLAAMGIRRGQVSVFATNALALAFWASLGGQTRSDLVVLSIPLGGAGGSG
ncbi:MAG TPA: GNAT family N-acetyltransferase [Polyangia bacterium]|nr:GNAT family N-acetyltransferase [Polyangia bacterium]